MWHDFLTALSLVLVLEGMMPFVNPSRWRAVMHRISMQPEKALRMMGFFSMLIGVGLLYLVR